MSSTVVGAPEPALREALSHLPASERNRATQTAVFVQTLFDLGQGLVDGFRRRAALRRTMDELNRLDDRSLADIGLSRATLHQVADGSFRRDGL